MLTPIKKQGDEHIYILLEIGIIDWMSGCYMGVLQVCQDAHWFRNHQRFYVDPGFYVDPNLRNCRQLRQK